MRRMAKARTTRPERPAPATKTRRAAPSRSCSARSSPGSTATSPPRSCPARTASRMVSSAAAASTVTMRAPASEPSVASKWPPSAILRSATRVRSGKTARRRRTAPTPSLIMSGVPTSTRSTRSRTRETSASASDSVCVSMASCNRICASDQVGAHELQGGAGEGVQVRVLDDRPPHAHVPPHLAPSHDERLHAQAAADGGLVQAGLDLLPGLAPESGRLAVGLAEVELPQVLAGVADGPADRRLLDVHVEGIEQDLAGWARDLLHVGDRLRGGVDHELLEPVDHLDQQHHAAVLGRLHHLPHAAEALVPEAALVLVPRGQRGGPGPGAGTAGGPAPPVADGVDHPSHVAEAVRTDGLVER